MKKNKRAFIFLSLFAILMGTIVFVLVKFSDPSVKFAKSHQISHSDLIKSSKSLARSEHLKKVNHSSLIKKDLPVAHQNDWDLVLVNRTHPKAELNPSLVEVDGKEVDARIATAVQAFLAAAKKISPAEHLISGYRSVAYQKQLYNYYLSQEMAGDGTVNQTGKSISYDQAVKNVQTYSQPPGCSEHDTGLAIDMSDINSLNASKIAPQIAKIAPQYGFVLRFPKGEEAQTGVDYEDWHFRYVGVANAEYMTQHHLTLESYLTLLPK